MNEHLENRQPPLNLSFQGDRNEFPAATYILLWSSNSTELKWTMYDQTGREKSNMVASKLEILYEDQDGGFQNKTRSNT